MPVSNDNQDYKNPENKNEQNGQQGKDANKSEQESPEAKNNMTSDNLKGKKVDADLERETDKPADV